MKIGMSQFARSLPFESLQFNVIRYQNKNKYRFAEKGEAKQMFFSSKRRHRLTVYSLSLMKIDVRPLFLPIYVYINGFHCMIIHRFNLECVR